MPVLAEKKLTPYQGLLHAIWTDERMSAVCTTMRNTDHIRENTDAARRFEPLKEADIRQLRDATLAHDPMLCADCDGRCSVAARHPGRAGQPHAVPDLSRAPRRPHRSPPALCRACSTKPATGRAPTLRRPAPPAPTGSISRDSCPRWNGTWPEKSDVFLIASRDVASRTHSPRPAARRGNRIVRLAAVATDLTSIRGSQLWP